VIRDKFLSPFQDGLETFVHNFDNHLTQLTTKRTPEELAHPAADANNACT
jgi:hypothetical protein